MKQSRIVCGALAALVFLSFSVSANAANMRAFWSGTVESAVAGNALALAVGDVIFADAIINTSDLESFSDLSFAGGLQVDATIYAAAPTLNVGLPNFRGQIRYLESMTWQALENGQVVASGSWSAEDIKFSSPAAVVPVPAALPLLIGGLGLLVGFKRRS